MSSRDQVLGRVRAALADIGEADEDVPRSYDLTRDFDPIETLVDRLVDYRARVRVIPGDDLPGEVAAAVRERRVAAPSGVPDAWLAGAAAVVRDEPPPTPYDLDQVDVVVTGCAVAIAETGTIVLDGGADQGRRALTLVPDHHVCVIRDDQIVRTVAEALRRLDPARPLTWISGPSATSDIELDRVEGVHGPRTLDVLIATGTPGRSP
ncbi:MAG TPA: lactate utilization protein C [Streptosporangiaceae bacterium]|nr:lactate utilization protein C [Streptosporangiaceae bacterium]